MSTQQKKKGLGRGLEALLGQASPVGAGLEQAPLSSLSLSLLQAGKYQPRQKMTELPLKELADSIRERGVMQPLLVRSVGAGRYEIIAGERRYRAAAMAGLQEVPVRVLEVDDQAAAAMALIENMQREDLNPLEESKGLARLIQEFGFTHEQTAKAVGKSRSAITNLLRLAQLASAVQAMLRAGELDMGHARALLPLPPANQVMLAQKIVADGLSVRDTEKLVTRFMLESGDLKTTNKKSKDQKSNSSDPDLQRLAREISDLIGLQVEIKTKARGGEVRLQFSRFDDLDAFLKKVGVSAF